MDYQQRGRIWISTSIGHTKMFLSQKRLCQSYFRKWPINTLYCIIRVVWLFFRIEALNLLPLAFDGSHIEQLLPLLLFTNSAIKGPTIVHTQRREIELGWFKRGAGGRWVGEGWVKRKGVHRRINHYKEAQAPPGTVHAEAGQLQMDWSGLR